MVVRRVGFARAPAHGFAPGVADRAPSGAVPLREETGDADARLIDRLVRRDELAFGARVREYQQRVFSIVLRMIGNAAEAEDLSQEVFVQVFKAVGSFRGESKLSTWIFRIAINLCKNRSKYLRVRHAGQQSELDSVEEHGALGDARRAPIAHVARPDDMLAGRQVERIVQNAILELEAGFRECLVLRDVQDLSYEEIGAITGLAEGRLAGKVMVVPRLAGRGADAKEAV